MVRQQTEQDSRVKMLDSFLVSTHRKLENILSVHRDVMKEDPLFYGHLGVWAQKNLVIRDHKELFVASLLVSGLPEHREAGFVLLQDFPPYEVARIVDMVKGRKIKLAASKRDPNFKSYIDLIKRMQKYAEEHPRAKSFKQFGPEIRRIFSIPSGQKVDLSVKKRKKKIKDKESGKEKEVTTYKITFSTFEKLLGRNVPRTMRQAVIDYLRKRENDNDLFDGAVMRSRKAMKSLYSRLKVAPSERAQEILFEDNPPKDSKLYKLKILAKEKNPTKQARLIVKHKIPYTIASSVIRHMTPAVLVALINSMTSQEVLQSLNSLQQRGALDNEDVKKLVEEKLEKAKKAKRVDALKGKKAASVAKKVSKEIREKVMEVTDEQLKKVSIKRPTALFIDKSGSMEAAIKIGKQLGALISPCIDADFYAYAFDYMGYKINCKSDKIADWEKALEYISAGGSTSCGVCLRMMKDAKERVEQIILITDEDENHHPYFIDVFGKYEKEMNVKPHVIIVKCGGWACPKLEQDCRRKKIPFDVINVSGTKMDDYSLPTLMTLLSKPSRVDLLMEIMNTPLPKKSDLIKKKKAS